MKLQQPTEKKIEEEEKKRKVDSNRVKTGNNTNIWNFVCDSDGNSNKHERNQSRPPTDSQNAETKSKMDSK